MPTVLAVCTQCGATLNVDSEKEATICSYCGTPFITEKAIQTYVTNQNTYINNAEKVVLADRQSLDEKLKAAETYIRLGNYKEAKRRYRELSSDYPYDYRTWWGILSSDMQNPKLQISRSALNRMEEIYRNVKRVSS